MTEAAIILAVTFIAALLHGGVGFGFGLVAVALLSIGLDVKEASVVLVLGGLSLNISMFLQLRRHFRLERITPFLIAAIVAVPLGVLFLVKADTLVLTRFLGVLLIVSAIQRLIPHLAKHRWHPLALGIPTGLLSGALAGAFGTGGPPAIAFVASQDFDRFRMAATLQAAFGISALVRIASLSAGGVLDQRLLLLSMSGVVGALAGGSIGLALLNRISAKTSKRLIASVLLMLGVWFLFAAGRT
jgi:uncharacterized protein